MRFGLCCCNTSGTLPCQPCPTGTKEWTLYVEAQGIFADSAGDGLIWGCLDFLYPDCAVEGSCQRQEYRRHAVGNTDLMGDYCENLICNSIVNSNAPRTQGWHLWKWSFCPGEDAAECDSIGGDCGPNVENDQDGAVRINFVIPNVHWNFTNCARDYPTTNTECATIINVTYTYIDSFTALRWDTVNGDCVSNTVTFEPRSNGQPVSSNEVTWICTYGRLVADGQRFAEGSYQLLRCEYPPAYRTYIPNYPYYCDIPGGVVCASSWGADCSPPTTWKPPSTIQLTRSA